MIVRLLILAAIIYLAIKYTDKKKRNRKIRTGRRLPKSELSVARSKFHQLAGDGFFDAVRERDKLILAFKRLSNSKVMRGDMESYAALLHAVNRIVDDRARDAEAIRSLGKLRERYDRSGDMFSDGLRTQITAYFDKSDAILQEEHFALRMNELQLAVRHLPWLIEQGEKGSDNSVHWQSNYTSELNRIKAEIAEEQELWRVISG